jgi:hypothetical protein
MSMRMICRKSMQLRPILNFRRAFAFLRRIKDHPPPAVYETDKEPRDV